MHARIDEPMGFNNTISMTSPLCQNKNQKKEVQEKNKRNPPTLSPPPPRAESCTCDIRGYETDSSKGGKERSIKES